MCGAIFAAAGPELEAACDEVGGCPVGEARITDGFGLASRHVIHAVGPVYGGGKGELKLKDILNAVLAMPVSEGDREKILTTNAVKLLKLGN